MRIFFVNLDQCEEMISVVPPFHWSKIPQKNSPLPLPFALHLKTPTPASDMLPENKEPTYLGYLMKRGPFRGDRPRPEQNSYQTGRRNMS